MPVPIKASDMQTAADLINGSGVNELLNRIAGAIAFERERIAQMVERADNTMMKQDKLADHIRGLSETR